MNHTKAINPGNHFPQDIIQATYRYMDELTGEEIRRNRKAYKRELNASTEHNELPEHTQVKRRCFLFLTASYDKA